MGRWAYFDNDTEHKFWFGTQSSEDITSLGGEVSEPTTIDIRWTKEDDYDNVMKEIDIMELKLHEDYKGMTYDDAMKRQDPEWCRSDESKGLTKEFWQIVARLDLAYKIRDGLQGSEELWCNAEYY